MHLNDNIKRIQHIDILRLYIYFHLLLFFQLPHKHSDIDLLHILLFHLLLHNKVYLLMLLDLLLGVIFYLLLFLSKLHIQTLHKLKIEDYQKFHFLRYQYQTHKHDPHSYYIDHDLYLLYFLLLLTLPLNKLNLDFSKSNHKLHRLFLQQVVLNDLIQQQSNLVLMLLFVIPPLLQNKYRPTHSQMVIYLLGF